MSCSMSEEIEKRQRQKEIKNNRSQKNPFREFTTERNPVLD